MSKREAEKEKKRIARIRKMEALHILASDGDFLKRPEIEKQVNYICTQKNERHRALCRCKQIRLHTSLNPDKSLMRQCNAMVKKFRRMKKLQGKLKNTKNGFLAKMAKMKEMFAKGEKK